MCIIACLRPKAHLASNSWFAFFFFLIGKHQTTRLPFPEIWVKKYKCWWMVGVVKLRSHDSCCVGPCMKWEGRGTHQEREKNVGRNPQRNRWGGPCGHWKQSSLGSQRSRSSSPGSLAALTLLSLDSLRLWMSMLSPFKVRKFCLLWTC